MDSFIRICKALMFIGAAAFISKVLYFPSDLSSSEQSNAIAQQPSEPPTPPFEPTSAMWAAIDPGESFRKDGWHFEFGEFTKQNIRVWVYWPIDQKATEEVVELMGKAMISDSIRHLKQAGFDVKKNGTSITYFFRKDPGGEDVIMLGSSGYISVLDQFYYSPPNNPFQ